MFTKANDAMVWQHVRNRRAELAAYLETLDTDKWNNQSLCGEWQTRDVVAHLLIEYHYTARYWKQFLRSGLRVNKFLGRTAHDVGRSDTAHLLERFKNMIDERQKPAALPVMNVLVDLLVHEQDIRVPLGHLKPMPLDSLRLIFSHWEPQDYNLGEKITGVSRRVRGLQFVISDLSLTKGTGLTVVGNAEDILLAVTGRPTAIPKLQGEGTRVLEERLG